MAELRLPCVIMRGGTSRGPYFRASDLPQDREELAEILIEAMGAGHELQVTGIGGGHPLTSKVAIVGKSSEEGADVDYLFAQVSVRERFVDFSPNCGNMLSGVGPFAIESGIVPATGDLTKVRIYNVNTRKLIEARVQTPNGRVRYDGDTKIDGVPGTAAPIYLAFLDAAGSKTGKLLPTGNASDVIDGIEVSCIDAAMPIMLLRASDLGVTGYETPAELNANKAMLARMESLRLEAGRRMGLGDVTKLVIPKPVLVAPPKHDGMITARYFMPHDCHTAVAVTGGIAIASGLVTEGTVAHAVGLHVELPATIRIEHPSGHFDIVVEQPDASKPPLTMVTRTARRIMEGTLLLSITDKDAAKAA